MAFYDTFDRCIDVDLYTANKTLITRVYTPAYGEKPDILVEGTILGMNVNISSKVTITNLDSSIDANAVKYLVVRMWYGGTFSSFAPYVVVFECLFADDVKQPPDRQTQFNCLTAALGHDIANFSWKFPQVAPTEDEVQKVPLTQVLAAWIKEYNSAVVKQFSGTAFAAYAPLLDPSPVTLTDKANEAQVSFTYGHDTDGTLYGGLVALNNVCKQVDANGNAYSLFAINVGNTALFVAENPAPTETQGVQKASFTEANAVNVDYIISAYRNGVVLTLSTLFDVEVTIGKPMCVDAGAILGRRAAGTLAADYLEVGKLYFQPTAGISYKFGTVRENRMDITGVLYK